MRSNWFFQPMASAASRCNICFKLTRRVTAESYENFVRIVIAKLQTRGIYKRSCEEGTLREGARLGSPYTGTAFRELRNRFNLLAEKYKRTEWNLRLARTNVATPHPLKTAAIPHEIPLSIYGFRHARLIPLQSRTACLADDTG